MKTLKLLIALLLSFAAVPAFAVNANCKTGVIQYSSGIQAFFAENWHVTVLPIGAQATASSSGTTITVASGHGVSAGQKIIVGLDATKYRTVSSTGATTIVVSSSVSVAATDPIINLGADTGVGSPNYDGSTIAIYSRPDLGGSAYASSTVDTGTIPTPGRYQYCTASGVSVAELVRNSSNVLNAYTPFALTAAAGQAGIGNVTSAGSSTANGVTIFVDTTGTAVQSSGFTCTTAGSCTIPAEEGLTVAPSTVAVNLSQVNANDSSQANDTCSGSGAANTWSWLDTDSSSVDAWRGCDGTSLGIMGLKGLDLYNSESAAAPTRLLAEADATSVGGGMYVPTGFANSTEVAWIPIHIASTTSIATQTGVVTAQSLLGATKATGSIFNITSTTLTSGGIGRTFRFKAKGVFTSDSGPGNTTFALKLGATVVATTGALALYPASATTQGWELEVDCLFTSVSTLSTSGVLCEGSVSGFLTTTTAWRAFLNNTSAVTVDMSAGGAVDLLVTESDAGSVTRGILASLILIR